jgi:hypothetical protein
MAIIEKQSSGYDIRDAFFNLLDADSYFAGYTRRKDKMLPVQQKLIPYLGVYLVDEVMTPDGDANAGCVGFVHAVRIGFSIVVASSTAGQAEQVADQGFLRVMATAYCDPKLMNVLHNNNPEGVGIEGIMRGARRPVHGAMSTDNETPFVEMQYEASCSFRSEWYPDITDTLNEIDVTVAVNNVDPASVPPIRVKYVFTQSARAPLRKPWLLARDQRRS